MYDSTSVEIVKKKLAAKFTENEIVSNSPFFWLTSRPVLQVHAVTTTIIHIFCYLLFCDLQCFFEYTVQLYAAINVKLISGVNKVVNEQF